MTDNTQPEALRLANVCSNLTRYSMDAHLMAAALSRQHARIAELESELEAVGAGGVQALSAAPAGFVPVAAFDRLHAHAESLAARLLAASPTLPAEQQAAQVIIDFSQVGTAGPFPVVNGRVSLPDATMQDLARMLRPTYEAEQQAAPEAAPGEREQAAQRLRELAGVSENDVTDPLHPRYIEGYKAGHAAGRRRAAPAASPTPPALSAAPAIAKLRHLYQNMVNGAVRDTASAKRIAEGLLAPAIEALERATPPAEQQAAPKAAPEVGNSGFDHKTAADLLNNKTVSDEAVRKFVATSREAEIAHLKKALLEAEAPPLPAPDCHHRPPCNECAAIAAQGGKA